MFGVPVSVKDNVDVEGMRSTKGLTSQANFKAPHDCGLVKTMKKSGMIPFVKTNVPQLISTLET